MAKKFLFVIFLEDTCIGRVCERVNLSGEEVLISHQEANETFFLYHCSLLYILSLWREKREPHVSNGVKSI